MKRTVSILLGSVVLSIGLDAVAQGAPEGSPPPGPAEQAPPPPPPPPPAAPASQSDLPPPPPPKQPAEPAPAEAPPIVVATPPLEPPARRSYHYHEGFYLRISGGLSAGRAFLATDSTSRPDFAVKGGGLGLDVLIGGSPAPGFALGGALLISGLTGTEIEINGRNSDVNTNASHVLIGAFVDGFPDPTGGFYLGGALGLAAAHIERKDEADPYDGGGAGLAAWAGYGFWVGPEWSLGGQLRFAGSITRQEEPELTRQMSTYGIALMFTALYH